MWGCEMLWQRMMGGGWPSIIRPGTTRRGGHWPPPTWPSGTPATGWPGWGEYFRWTLTFCEDGWDKTLVSVLVLKKWNFKFSKHPVTRKERGREGDTCQKVMCLVLSEQTHFWFYQPKILYINHDWIKMKMQPKQGAKNKSVIHLLREWCAWLRSCYNNAKFCGPILCVHAGTHPKYRLHFCGWVTYTFFLRCFFKLSTELININSITCSGAYKWQALNKMLRFFSDSAL